MKIEAKEGVSGQGYHLAELGFGPHSDSPRVPGRTVVGSVTPSAVHCQPPCCTPQSRLPSPPPPTIRGLQAPFSFWGKEGHKLGPESLEFDLNSPVLLGDPGSCLSLLCLRFTPCNKRLWETLCSQTKVEEGMKFPSPGFEHTLHPCSGLDLPCAPGGG